jgi:hypothetical protein
MKKYFGFLVKNAIFLTEKDTPISHLLNFRCLSGTPKALNVNNPVQGDSRSSG